MRLCSDLLQGRPGDERIEQLERVLEMGVDAAARLLARGSLALAYLQTGDEALNAVDYLLGAEELMDVRAKHTIRRPFILFDEIEAEAEKATLDRERQLRADIDAAQEELNEKRQELSGRNAALFQKKLQEEVEWLNDRVREGNRELREIRKEQRETLEREKERVRLAVMGWMPTLILGLGFALAARRHAKRRQSMAIER